MKKILTLLISMLILSCSTAVEEIEPLKRTIPLDSIPCNPDATDETQEILRYIADLSSDELPGAISGQSCGHVNNIVDPDDIMGFEQQAAEIFRISGKWPGIIGLDYGHDRIYSPRELTLANRILIDYWNNGGLIAVGFSPSNPWLNDESDIENNPGSWEDTRTSGLTSQQKRQIDLDALIDPEQDIYRVWRRKLDRIADALQELEDAGVVVLFKPMQEQNGNWFWWGIDSHESDPGPYIRLYRDMYNYFTVERGLNNILWMYSPNKNSSDSDKLPQQRPPMWVYPGDDVVDIIAPTSYNNSGTIYSYNECMESDKPFAMAEYGSHFDNINGTFDNMTYIEKISGSYPATAFWISWHDWNNGDGTQTLLSIGRNANCSQLMNDSRVVTRDKLSY